MSGLKDGFCPENMDQVSHFVLEHYIKHYDVVRMKLGHAKDATRQSLNELAANQNEKGVPQIREIEAYDKMWDQILKAFRTAGMTEDELERIEDILMRIPRLIKKYYDLLVEQDPVLQTLMQELHSPEYQEALAIARKVQSGPDALSGLQPEEFDLQTSSLAFMYKAPKSKK